MLFAGCKTTETENNASGVKSDTETASVICSSTSERPGDSSFKATISQQGNRPLRKSIFAVTFTESFSYPPFSNAFDSEFVGPRDLLTSKNQDRKFDLVKEGNLTISTSDGFIASFSGMSEANGKWNDVSLICAGTSESSLLDYKNFTSKSLAPITLKAREIVKSMLPQNSLATISFQEEEEIIETCGGGYTAFFAFANTSEDPPAGKSYVLVTVTPSVNGAECEYSYHSEFKSFLDIETFIMGTMLLDEKKAHGCCQNFSVRCF